MEKKRYWSRNGIILGIILMIINILFSIPAYNDPAIRNPESFSDFKLLLYPNVLLGLPVVLPSGVIVNVVVSPFYQPQQYSSIPDDPNFYNVYDANGKMRDEKRAVILFVQLFIFLSLYWFIIGTILVWIYNKLSKINKILFIIVVLFILFSVQYLTLVSLHPQTQTVLPQRDISK